MQARRKRSTVVAMPRLAKELRLELTPLQRREVEHAFAVPHPNFERLMHLTPSQRNALRLLLEANHAVVLADFFAVREGYCGD